MPYSGPADPKLPPAVRKLPKALREVWIRVFNEHYDAENEAEAFKMAWGAVRKIQSAKEARIASRQNMDDLRVWLYGEKAMKTDGGVRYPADSYLYVPDGERPSTWRWRIADSIGGVSLDDLAAAAKSIGPDFRETTVAMSASDRRKCAQTLLSLYRKLDVPDADIPDYLFPLAGAARPGAKTLAFSAGFKTIQQEDGRVRWVMLSSGAFEDRDGEIVSKAFLESALDFAEEYDFHGTASIWHVKGSSIASCDGQWLVGDPPFLLETGLFDTNPAGQAAAKYYAEHASETGGSIELYGIRDDEGVWHAPGVIIRRSFLPSKWAAFPWSSVAVKEMKMSKKREEVVSEFAGALGISTDDAEKVLQHLEAGSKELADYGIRWKEADAPETAVADAPETPAPAPTGEVVEEAPVPAEVSAVVEAAPVIETPAEESALEVVITPDAMDQIVNQTVEVVRGMVSDMLTAANARIEEMVKAITTIGEQQLAVAATTKELADTVTDLKRTDDEKINRKVNNLPRATVKALQPPIVRPTQREPEAKEEAPNGESMLDRAYRTLHTKP